MGVLALALVQYPVHSYMVFALRNANEAQLVGDSENTCGFGQVVALALLGASVLECVRAAVGEYPVPQSMAVLLPVVASRADCL